MITMLIFNQNIGKEHGLEYFKSEDANARFAELSIGYKYII